MAEAENRINEYLEEKVKEDHEEKDKKEREEAVRLNRKLAPVTSPHRVTSRRGASRRVSV